MYEQLIFGALGGLGLFLLGMKNMSEGLQKVAGDRLRNILEALTNNRIMGMLVGLFVTAIVQSSSATTVMVVSFVNAGLMTLVQAIGVILGANIGTTVTAQMIAFKIHHYALPAIGIGFGMRFFMRGKRIQYLGQIILGFGLLFFGLSIMKDGFAPLKHSQDVLDFMVKFSQNIPLAIVVGAVFTMLVQSSSATVGITMTLAAAGLINFPASVAIILGDNIGTTITAQLAAIGGNVSAKRAARAHALFNVFGVAYILIFFPYFIRLVEYLTPGSADFIVETADQAARYGLEMGDKPYIARHIANAHTLFNVVNVLVFLPLVGLLVKISTLMVPQRGEEDLESRLSYLHTLVVETPSLALSEARKETIRMADLADKMFRTAMEAYEKEDLRLLEKVRKYEDAVDRLQKEISDFLVPLAQQSITVDQAREIGSLINMVHNFERIGDQSENLSHLIERKIEEKVLFTDMAKEEFEEARVIAQEFLDYVIGALKREDRTIMDEARRMEDDMDRLERTLRENHIDRLNKGVCTVNAGLIFMDMLHNLERIADHCHNIAEAIVGIK